VILVLDQEGINDHLDWSVLSKHTREGGWCVMDTMIFALVAKYSLLYNSDGIQLERCIPDTGQQVPIWGPSSCAIIVTLLSNAIGVIKFLLISIVLKC